MLAIATEFPQTGSAAFVKGSADPVTILQRNADDTCVVRLDARPGQLAPRGSTGNRRVDLADLCATEDEALFGPGGRQSRKATSTRRRAGKR